jgi:hypothetical protein
MKRAGEEWKKMDEKEKAPFLKSEADDLKRHERQLAELKAKGYFTMDDGTRSSEHAAKKKKSKKSRSQSKQKGKSGEVKKGRRLSKKRASEVDQGVKSKKKSSSDDEE